MWDDDNIQFPRLLAEINAVGLSDEQIDTIAESMSIDPPNVQELLDRAEVAWEAIKDKRNNETAKPQTKQIQAKDLSTGNRIEVNLGKGTKFHTIDKLEIDDVAVKITLYSESGRRPSFSCSPTMMVVIER